MPRSEQGPRTPAGDVIDLNDPVDRGRQHALELNRALSDEVARYEGALRHGRGFPNRNFAPPLAAPPPPRPSGGNPAVAMGPVPPVVSAAQSPAPSIRRVPIDVLVTEFEQAERLLAEQRSAVEREVVKGNGSPPGAGSVDGAPEAVRDHLQPHWRDLQASAEAAVRAAREAEAAYAGVVWWRRLFGARREMERLRAVAEEAERACQAADVVWKGAAMQRQVAIATERLRSGRVATIGAQAELDRRTAAIQECRDLLERVSSAGYGTVELVGDETVHAALRRLGATIGRRE